MAKNISNDDADDNDDKFEKMDDETLGFLEQVRKGKSRNFVLSMKGNKVRSMVVKKKPIKEKDRKAARGEGFQPIHGVASGMGAKITFTIARSDGFDEKAADRKTEKLKKFLSSQTGKVFKPDFELVDSPPPIPFDEDDLNDPLVAKFMKMEPVIAKACETHPESVPQIQESVNAIRDLLQDDATRQQAGPAIADFVQYLKDLMSGVAVATSQGAEGSTGQTSTVTSEDPAAQAKQLTEKLKKLKPFVDKVVTADPARKTDLDAAMVRIVGEIKGQQVDVAAQSIAELANTLKELMADSTSTSSPDTIDQMQAFADRRDALEPRFLEAKRLAPDKATKLAGVWDYANQQAHNGNVDTAVAALTRLNEAIDGILSAPSISDAERHGIEEGIVEVTREKLIEAFQKSKLVWERTRASIQAELQKLEQAILDVCQEEEDFDAIKANSGSVYIALDELDDELIHVLDDAAATEDKKTRADLHSEAREIVQRYMDYVAADEFLGEVDSNPFTTVKVRATLESSLSALAKSLQARELAG